VNGQRYPIQARNIQQVCGILERKCGINATHQQVFYHGKKLQKTQFLEEIGLIKDDVLQVVDNQPSSPFGIGASPGNMQKGNGNFTKFQTNLMNEMMKEIEKRDPRELLEEILSNNDFENILKDKNQLVLISFLPPSLISSPSCFIDPQEKSRQLLLKNLDQYEKFLPGRPEQKRFRISFLMCWFRIQEPSRVNCLKSYSLGFRH
jgi:hypothetical protein